jgi:N-glycosylase/DNA lyase
VFGSSPESQESLKVKPTKNGRKTKINGSKTSHSNGNCIDSAGVSKDHDLILNDYFQLAVNLKELYSTWSEVDDNFKSVAEKFPGVRILRQDPVENLLSFICSSNNNISRISGMVENLCVHFGEPVTEVDGQMHYAVPSIEKLAQPGVEETLRKLGFGYRARFIVKSCQKMLEKEPGWLVGLRERPYEEAKEELMGLPGVGPKVADCVCLMSLDKMGALPVDTHVWQITASKYLKHLNRTKSLTPTVYSEIGDFYRKRFGDYAGWAHSVLFTADLKPNKNKDTEQIGAEKKKKRK